MSQAERCEPNGGPEGASPEQSGTGEARTRDGGDPQPDVVLIHGVTPDGGGLRVIRHRNAQLEAGAIRPVRQGQPVYGELVRLKPRESCPLICDVEVQLPAPAARAECEPAAKTADAARKGPPQVVSDRYRSNWDMIWNRSGEKDLPS